MVNVLQLSANAHKTFELSINEKKRKLIKLVLSTLKLNGCKLEFTLRPPFDAFVKTAKNKEWLGREDSNLRPTIPKTVALPTELHPIVIIVASYSIFSVSVNILLIPISI